jgi:hypothetical protein
MTATHTPSPTATIAPTATPIPLPVVSQWGIFELELTSDQSYSDTEKFQDVTLMATFTGPEGTSYEVRGFWDGDNTWRIRFAPPMAGEWAYTVTSTDNDLDAVTNDGAFLAEAVTAAQIATNPNWRGFLRVSDNGRYLTYADGTPFFWLGDTIWRGNHLSMAFERDPDDAGPDVAEFPAYVTNRQAKGFTVIQIVAGYPNDPDIVNEGGSTYLEPYTTINPAYFQWLDKRIDLIVAQGMVPVIVGQWHEAVNDMPLPALRGYWDYLLARYQAHNVVWVTVGEYGFVEDLEKVRQLSAYIDNSNAVDQLITIHPTPNMPHSAYSSTTHFSGESWLDFHMHQTWNLEATRKTMVSDYEMNPPLPIVNAEAGYDGLWTWTREKVRHDAWTVYLSGGAGYTYGVQGIWNWNDGCCDDDWSDPPRFSNTPRWFNVINLPSSQDMARLADFFANIAWWELTPRDDLVSSGYMLAKPGEIYLLYLPHTEFPDETASKLGAFFRLARRRWQKTAVVLDLSEASGTFQGQWFNPATGEYMDIDPIVGNSHPELTPPFAGDAVLFLTRQ